MKRCLLDTMVLSELLRPERSRPPTVNHYLRQYFRSHGRVTFSDMSRFEVLRGLRRRKAANQEAAFLKLCGQSEVLEISSDVLDQAATLWADSRNSGRLVDDADLIIAATGLVHQLPVVTHNVKHFQWIAALSLIDWRA